MATLIKDGRIVTAEGELRGRHPDRGRQGRGHRPRPAGGRRRRGARRERAAGDAGAVDVHTHLDWEFGTARTVDTFGSGTMAAAFGGTTSVIDFANQSHGASPLGGPRGLAPALREPLRRRRRAHDRPRPVPAGARGPRTLARDEGVTSFKLFMAYPNVLMVDDGVCFYVMREAAKHGAVVCVHAENGYAINVLVQRGGRRRQHRAQVPLPDPPARARGRGDPARDHARRIRRRAPLRRARHLRARRSTRSRARKDRSDLVHGETCTQYCSSPARSSSGRASRGRNTSSRRRCAASEHQDEIWRACGGATCRRSRPTTARSASRSSPTAEVQQAPGRGRGLSQDPERRPRHRAPFFRVLRRRGEEARHVARANSSSWSRPTPPSCSASSRRRARSRSGPTPTSCCSTPTSAGRSAPRTSTRASTTRCSKASRSRAASRRPSCAAS